MKKVSKEKTKKIEELAKEKLAHVTGGDPVLCARVCGQQGNAAANRAALI